MKKTFMKTISLLTLISILLSSAITVSAAGNEISYDLTKSGTQTFSYQDNSGNTIFVTITELPATSRSLENRTYKVAYRSLLAWEAGYNVVIHNNQITSVNSPYHICYTGSIFSSVLKRDSTKQATLSFIYKVGGINTSTGVRTKIINEQLNVTVL